MKKKIKSPLIGAQGEIVIKKNNKPSPTKNWDAGIVKPVPYNQPSRGAVK